MGTIVERRHGQATEDCAKCGGPRVWKQFGKKGIWARYCFQCSRSKSEAFRAENPSYGKEHREANQEYHKDRHKTYREEHKEEERDRAVTWRENNREVRRQTQRDWRKANHGEVNAKAASYHKAHPEKRRAFNHKRRASKANAQSDGILCDHRGHECYVCGKGAEAIDHVVPLARGGSDLVSNKRPICTSCNSAKGAHTWPGQPDWETFLESRSE